MFRHVSAQDTKSGKIYRCVSGETAGLARWNDMRSEGFPQTGATAERMIQTGVRVEKWIVLRYFGAARFITRATFGTARSPDE